MLENELLDNEILENGEIHHNRDCKTESFKDIQNTVKHNYDVFLHFLIFHYLIIHFLTLNAILKLYLIVIFILYFYFSILIN
jgi:hypothetical protein